MTYTYQNCGSDADDSNKLCNPVNKEHESISCGVSVKMWLAVQALRDFLPRSQVKAILTNFLPISTAARFVFPKVYQDTISSQHFAH